MWHIKGTSSNFLSVKNISYFVQRNRIDLFEESSTGIFGTKIYSTISIKFALEKYVLTIFVPSKDQRLNGCNAKIC